MWGGIDNEVLSNLVTHVTQLTKQLGRQQSTANAHRSYANFVEDNTVI